MKIVMFPHPALLTRATSVETVSPETLFELDRMLRLLADSRGYGLAANQVGILKRMFVMAVPPDPKRPSMPGRVDSVEPTICINPRVEGLSGRAVPMKEFCLSQPGVGVIVKRCEIGTLHYQDVNMQPRKIDGFGLLVRVWQHEIDHLDGINIGRKTR